MSVGEVPYCGRVAPSPTGHLHLGHARTFWFARERARRAGGRLLLRIEDIDGARCRREFVNALTEDLRWVGVDWDGVPLLQSDRYDRFRAALLVLLRHGHVYPCYCSRRDVQMAAGAPHPGQDEAVYPGICRPVSSSHVDPEMDWERFQREFNTRRGDRMPCWRFRVPDGSRINFLDERCGAKSYRGGEDFGDFVLWRSDGVVSYQLACVVDDSETGVTEVVRGEDLLVSTARQLLLYRALGLNPPRWLHCGLVMDESGNRLAKRSAAAGLRELRERGCDPSAWHALWRREFEDEIRPASAEIE